MWGPEGEHGLLPVCPLSKVHASERALECPREAVCAAYVTASIPCVSVGCAEPCELRVL